MKHFHLNVNKWKKAKGFFSIYSSLKEKALRSSNIQSNGTLMLLARYNPLGNLCKNEKQIHIFSYFPIPIEPKISYWTSYFCTHTDKHIEIEIRREKNWRKEKIFPFYFTFGLFHLNFSISHSLFFSFSTCLVCMYVLHCWYRMPPLRGNLQEVKKNLHSPNLIRERRTICFP